MKLKAPMKPAPKTSQRGKVSEATPEPTPPDNQRRYPDSMPTSLAANPIGMSPERKAMYEEANTFSEQNGDTTPSPEGDEGKTQELETPTETPPEEGDADTSTETEGTETPETPPEEEPKGEEEPAEEPSENAEGEEVKRTTVPHAALHEERMSHKETKAKLNEAIALAREAASQAERLVKENEELRKSRETQKPEPEPEGPIDDIESYSRTLSKRLDNLEAENQRLREERHEERLQSRDEKLNRSITLVDEELGKQGLPGFSKFKHLVAEKIAKKANGDRAVVLRYDNPEGWIEIYRTEVYPEVASIFKVTAKTQDLKNKEEKKLQGKMVGNHGKQPPKPAAKEPKPWGLSDYFSHRQKERIS